MAVPSTRRFEMGLPLFSGLDLGKIAQAQSRLEAGEVEGLSDFLSILSNAATARTIRRLSAVWTASDNLLKSAEADPAVMATLELDAAEKPFIEAFKDAMDFQSALWKSLGVTPASSAVPDEPKSVSEEGAQPISEGFPSGS